MLTRRSAYFLVICLWFVVTIAQAQGPLTPSGAPGETMKSLTQIYDQATSAAQQAALAGQAATDAYWEAYAAKDRRTALSNPKFLYVGADAAITISQPGSYYLSENIRGWSGKAGIKITTQSVTLDLNGFSLIGIPAATHGIYITSAAGSGHIIRNGTIRNWGHNGVYADGVTGGMYESIVSMENGWNGFILGGNYHSVRCIARGNAQVGFRNYRAGGVYNECTATSNSSDGFSIYGGIAENCVANFNNRHGIFLEQKSIIRMCNAHENKMRGIQVSGMHNTVADCIAAENAGDGINVSGLLHDIKNNTCSGNGGAGLNGAGIRIGPSTNGVRLEGNALFSNNYGIRIESTGNFASRNVARDNGSNFNFVPGNRVGPIGNVETATSPWANLEF